MHMTTESTRDDWDEHWTQFGDSAELGPTPRYRRRLINSLLNIDAAGTAVKFLEIGSGTGEFAEEFARKYPRASYLGLELSLTGVQVSQKRVPSASFAQRDLLHPLDTDELAGFGATHALCSEVLEHLEDPARLLKNAARYCASGCRLIVTVPGGPMNAFYQHIGHRQHYSPAALAALLERSGFSVESAFGAGFPFFNLFRLLIALRGPKFVSDVSGPPSTTVRIASKIFELLFRFNSSKFGWQTFAIARYRG
jgi:SAM-dependent methyltransferase